MGCLIQPIRKIILIASSIKICSLKSYEVLLGICVVVAQQTLNLLVQVRFLYPLPYKNTFAYAGKLLWSAF